MASTRRLSPLDAAFLYFEKPHQRLHVGCVAIIEGRIPFPEFSAAMAERLEGVRRYRQRPVRPLLDLDWPRWEDDPLYDVRRHLRHVAVPGAGGDAELHALVDTLFAAPLDDSHPLWATYLLDGLAGGRSAVLCKVHHSMIDGVSGAQLLELMSDPRAAQPSNGGSAAISEPAPAPSGLRARLAALSPFTLASRAWQTFDAARTLAPLLLEPVSDTPFNGRITDDRHIVWTSFDLDDFLTMRGAAGCKVNDVVLAVIAGALRRYLEVRGVGADGTRIRTLVPVSVRPPEERLTLGNLVSSMFPNLPVGIADPVERLQRIAAEMQRLKERGQAQAAGLFMALAGALPAPASALLGRLLPERAIINTVTTNVPGPRELCSILGRQILDVHPIVPLFQTMGMEFAILSYARRLSISAVVDPHLVPDADIVPGLLQEAAHELRAALAVGVAPTVAATTGPSLAELMTADVVAISAEDTLATASQLMRGRRIRHLPVLDGSGRLVGLVTHRDLLAASPSSLLRDAEQNRLLSTTKARDVMETHLSVAFPDDAASQAGQCMMRHKIGCLPVVGGDARLVGIVTEEDFVRWATEHMAPAEGSRASA
jgi:WS/DGAT/MGAT family acyltransferase